MRLSFSSLVPLSLSLLSLQLVAGSPGQVLQPRRATSILNGRHIQYLLASRFSEQNVIDPAGQPPLPPPAAAAAAASRASLNLDNIQGDILLVYLSQINLLSNSEFILPGLE